MWAVAGIDSQNKEALAHEDDAKMTQILPIKTPNQDVCFKST